LAISRNALAANLVYETVVYDYNVDRAETDPAPVPDPMEVTYRVWYQRFVAAGAGIAS